MAGFTIEINANTNGDVNWKLEALHAYENNNDADCKNFINVITKINHFVDELKNISKACETEADKSE